MTLKKTKTHRVRGFLKVGNRGRNMKAAVIASGFREIAQQAAVNYDFYPHNAADKNVFTYFAADCGAADAKNKECDLQKSHRYLGFGFF